MYRDCPTQAFIEPRVLDARKCISLTIEMRAMSQLLSGRHGKHGVVCERRQEGVLSPSRS